MKHSLLTLLFSFFILSAFAQQGQDNNASNTWSKQSKISIYPNPATNYISINTDENIKQIMFFNLLGRNLKTITDVVKGQQYDVTDLPNGMYLVQIIDSTNKILTTQRVSKR
jgi:hypothetical protein